jgi:hypothetical protein
MVIRHLRFTIACRGEGILPLIPTAGKPVLSIAKGMPAGRKAGTASPQSILNRQSAIGK